MTTSTPRDYNPPAEPFYANFGWDFDPRNGVWLFKHGRTEALYDPATRRLLIWRKVGGETRWIRRADERLPLPWEPTYAGPGSKAKRRTMAQRAALCMPCDLACDYGRLPDGLGYAARRGRNGAAEAGPLQLERRAG